MNYHPLRKSRVGRAASALLCASLLSSCVMGPDYQRPQVTQPNDFRFQINQTDATSFADLAWWDVFRDPALQSLIGNALANNYDLQVATARIEQARELIGVARSQALPQLNYDGHGGIAKKPGDDQDIVGSYTSAAGILNAAWEFDVWGRIKRATEAARANTYQQEEIRRGIMLTLVSDVATGYFRLIQLDRELAIALDSKATFSKTHELFSLRFQAGRDSRLPVERAKSSLDESTAQVAEIEREIAQQENALSILTGAYPGPIPRGMALTAQQMPPQTPVGLTTELLKRRPDIRAAEQGMISANAQIGEAVANFYPKIGLSALAGLIGIGSAGALNGSSGFWRGGLNLAGPIFTGGRLESEYRNRKAYWDETVAQYRQTILVAFRETSDALVAQQKLAAQRAALETKVAAIRQSIDLALERYHSGRASYFEVIEAQQQLFPAEDQLAQVQQAQLVAVVNLYKALGGGWNMTDDQFQRRS
ncbi:MAG TPA: efflux transporter outer membrane subunit [Sphingomicrobium sp.]